MRVAHAIQSLQAGKPVILTDDPGRENEGDLIYPAEVITPEIVNFMIRQGSGIVCLCLTPEWVKHLQLPLMVPTERNTNPHGLACTISIEARHGVTTGVSAQDRAHTILTAVNPHVQSTDLLSPGHVFPLRAVPGGLRERQGHTEGSIELVQRAGFRPAAVICEIMNPDGSMTHGADLERFAKQHDLAMVSIEELINSLS